MAKIEGMALNVVLRLAKAELMSAYRTGNVEIMGVGFDWDVYESDEDGERSLMVDAYIMSEEECFKKDCGRHHWVMVWNEEACEFHTLMRWDQDADDDNGMSPRDLLIGFFATCIDKVKDGEQRVYLKDVICYYDIDESLAEKAKAILNDYMKKMKRYQEDLTAQEDVERLLDVTARKLTLLSNAC